MSPCLFNVYAEYIMRNAGLDEAQAGIKIAGRNINNLRCAVDTALMAESEEELKSLLIPCPVTFHHESNILVLLSANQSEPVHMAAVSSPPQAELHTDTQVCQLPRQSLQPCWVLPASLSMYHLGYSQEENTRITIWGHFAALRDCEILAATPTIMT